MLLCLMQQSLDVIPQGQGRLSFANPTNISMTVESVDGQPLNWTLGYHDVSSTLCSVAFLEAHVTSSLVPPPSSLIHHPSPFTTHPSSLTTYYSPIHSVTPHPSPTPHSLFTLTYPQSPPSQFRPYNSLPVGNHTVCIRQEGDTSCDKHVISLGNEEAVSLVMAREQQPIEVSRSFPSLNMCLCQPFCLSG